MIRRATLLATALLIGAAPPGPVVQTDLGAVRGAAVPGGATFRGIPFAAPPTGDRRWRAPGPARRWAGTRDATRFGANCIQSPRGGEAGATSEDCLTLTVVTPDPKARKLPVLVSIHGGAFAFGSGRYLADMDASPIVRRGVVLVSPNYRVGRMGFLAHPALTAEGMGAGTANFWLMDQIAALGWVRRNIARFGGDPDNVTVLGCSAGGSSVNGLMVAPPARGLFHKAVVRSGGGLFNASRPLALAEEQGVAFAARAGVTGTGAQALARLRALSPAAILAADPGPPEYGAVVDGIVLPLGTAQAYATGRVAKVPLIAGSTSDEASVFGLMGFDKSVLKTRFGVDVDALRPVYDAAAGARLTDAELLRQVQTDFIFTAASLGVPALADRAGLPAWAYHFAYLGKGESAKPGVPHCGDMGWLFGARAGQDEADRAVSRMMQDQLVAFITRGDPNGPGLPVWPRYSPPHPRTLVIGDTTRAVPDFRARQLDWFLDKAGREAGTTVPR